MPRVRATVIIPNWNGRWLLNRSLPALLSQSYREFEILVVDNGSTDKSVAWIQSNFPNVQVIALDHNTGFAAACNCGIQASSSELVVTLNNDTVPNANWLARLVEAADLHKDIGMFASTILLDRTPRTIDATGVRVNRLGIAQNIGHGSPITSLPCYPAHPFGPCAGAALYRRQLLDDVGTFDERYFAYLEDVELAWRARWAGWSCMSVPDSIVLHAHSATGGQDPARKYWHLGRNRIWTTLRHYPRPQLWYYCSLIVLFELITGLLGTIVLRSPAPMKGRLEALRTWQYGLRAASTSPRRLSSSEMFTLLAPAAFPQWRSPC